MKRLRKRKIEDIKRLLIETQFTYAQIAEAVGCSQTSVHYQAVKVMTTTERQQRFYANKSRAVTGDRHPNYKTGRSVQGQYATVVKPHWYTGRINCTRVYEHHVVYCEANGITEIPKGFCVHHTNGDKLDNRLENLQLMSLSEHTRIHNLSECNDYSARK